MLEQNELDRLAMLVWRTEREAMNEPIGPFKLSDFHALAQKRYRMIAEALHNELTASQSQPPANQLANELDQLAYNAYQKHRVELQEANDNELP